MADDRDPPQPGPSTRTGVEAMSYRDASGDVWIACASCRVPLELANAVEVAGRNLCPRCAAG